MSLITEDIEFLCSDLCAGRAPGTPGHAEARSYLTRRLEEIGLHPGGSEGWEHRIAPHGGANLVGAIPNSGANSERAVIVSAHYDHLGVIGGRMHPGAGDNASGVAALMEAARRLVDAGTRLDRRVLVVLFDQEEPPYFADHHMGSIQFVNDDVVPAGSIDMMITLDIVGVPIGPPDGPPDVVNAIFVAGAERSAGTSDLLRSSTGALPLGFLDACLVPPLSDHLAFEAAGVPFLFYTTGRSATYHTAWDTPDRLDLAKMQIVSDHLVEAIQALANRADAVIDYSDDSHDYGSTIETLLRIITPFVGLDPLVRDGARDLDLLQQRLEERALNQTEVAELQQLLFAVESGLATI